MNNKSCPNPDWHDAPYEMAGWTPERGFFIDTTPPPSIMNEPKSTALKTPEELAAIDLDIINDKQLRIDLDRLLQELKSLPSSRERALSITKIQEAIMWLGMDLKRLNDGKTCYENGYKANDKVDPVADGLKL